MGLLDRSWSLGDDSVSAGDRTGSRREREKYPGFSPTPSLSLSLSPSSSPHGACHSRAQQDIGWPGTGDLWGLAPVAQSRVGSRGRVCGGVGAGDWLAGQGKHFQGHSYCTNGGTLRDPEGFLPYPFPRWEEGNYKDLG